MTDLAEYLAGRGIPFREAHGAVARLARHCAEKGLSPGQLPLAELRKFSEGFQEEVFALLTPEASVQSRRSPGGTAPPLVEERVRRLSKGKA
jgi:argininosuccinate lyase